MRIGWASIAAAVICGAVGIGAANAAEPTQIKVGILLPLTGPFAAVAETQKQGALLAVDVINKQGGLNMPWGRVKVEGVVDDDEAKLDVGVRRYRYDVLGRLTDTLDVYREGTSLLQSGKSVVYNSFGEVAEEQRKWGPATHSPAELNLTKVATHFYDNAGHLFNQLGADGLTVYSPESPLGSAINGRSKGDTVTYLAPNGKELQVVILDAVPFTG